jgi:hypothetical protein
MTEQTTETKAQRISERTWALAQQLGERAFAVKLQLERCLTVLGEATVDELLHETEQIEQGDGLLTNDGARRRTKGGVFLHLAKQRCTPEQRTVVFPVTDWRAQKARRNAHRTAAPPPPSAPASAVPVKAIYVFPGVVSMKTTLKGRPVQSTVLDGYARLLFERTEAKDSFPAGIPAAPSEPQRVTVYIGTKQWRKVADELQKPSINLTIDGVMILEDGKLVLRAQGVSVYEKITKQ